MRGAQWFFLFAGVASLAACDSGGGDSSTQIASGDHCNTVFYQELIGSYSGTLRSDEGSTSRPCEWALSMSITGDQANGTCRVSAAVSSTAVKFDDAEDLRYSCQTLNETVDFTAAIVPTFAELSSPSYPVTLSFVPRSAQDLVTGGLQNSWPFMTENAVISPSEITFVNGTLQKGLGL